MEDLGAFHWAGLRWRHKELLVLASGDLALASIPQWLQQRLVVEVEVHCPLEFGAVLRVFDYAGYAQIANSSSALAIIAADACTGRIGLCEIAS